MGTNIRVGEKENTEENLPEATTTAEEQLTTEPNADDLDEAELERLTAPEAASETPAPDAEEAEDRPPGRAR